MKYNYKFIERTKGNYNYKVNNDRRKKSCDCIEQTKKRVNLLKDKIKLSW